MSPPEGGESSGGWEDDGEETVMMQALASGAFFGERFRVGAVLGSGAMGRVVKAVDLTTGQEVALKVLHPERARDVESVARLEREAAILAAIGHPGIVRVVALGRAADRTPWLAMELLQGETLKSRLARGPMSPLEVVPILNVLCDALAAAHIRGIVHRDLKPENLLLVEGGNPACKVLDFGLSRFTASKTLTANGAILGTPRYMPPEQIRSASTVDLRVDVYAVGVLLYEMLTARSPYPAEDLGQLLGCVLEGRVIPLGQVRPVLPPAVGAVIARAMARDPSDRFQTAGAIAEAYANGLGVSSGRSMLMSGPMHGATANDEGAAPLVDPFESRPLAARAAEPPRAPTPMPAPPREPGAEPPSRPGRAAEFTQPRASQAAPQPRALQAPVAGAAVAPRPRAARSPIAGCAVFIVALVLVIVVAALGAVGLRMLVDGRAPVPSSLGGAE